MPLPSAISALRDFRRARRRADVQRVLTLLSGGLLSGAGEKLLAYDEVRRRLKAVETPRRQLEYIPLDAIVGSVGRYQDFNRSFMPLSDAQKGRWVDVQQAMTSLEGVPPIEVYKLGGAYFVKDGHHRVSVARQLGAKRIEAYVTQVAARVPVSADLDQDELIIATELANFLERTNLDRLRPEADLTVTAPGRYPELLEHIEVHRYFMGIDLSRPVEWEEAVVHWYDEVYLKVARAIRDYHLLDEFPGRTEADLYLFLSEHRGRLEREFGWEIEGPLIAEGIAAHAPTLQQRASKAEGARGERLLESVLVILREGESGALPHAAALARLEGAELFGLLLTRGKRTETEQAFVRAAESAGVRGQLAVRNLPAREEAREVRARAKYAGAVVLPAADPLTPALLRSEPKPLLLTGAAPPGGARPLLAYDGGDRAREALFAFTYFVLRTGSSALVVHVGRGAAAASILEEATSYLSSRGVSAEAVMEGGPVAATVARIATQQGADLLFTGSHSRARWVEEMLGGVVDDLLPLTELPLLVT